MKTQKITAFSVSTDDKPGAWAHLMNGCKQNNCDLSGIGGWEKDGKGQFMIVPKDPSLFKNVAQKEGWGVVEEQCIYLTASDKVGALCEIANKVAEAGINLRAVDAIGADGNVGCFLWCRTEDFPKLEAVL